MALRSYLVGEVAEDFADGLLPRREALRRLGLLGLGLGSASALLAACGSPAAPGTAAPSATASAPAAPKVPAGPPPGRGPGVGRGADVRFAGPAGELRGAWAAPTSGAPKGAVLVLTERVEFQGTAGTLEARYQLAAGGRKLKKATHVAMPDGTLDTTTVYDRE